MIPCPQPTEAPLLKPPRLPLRTRSKLLAATSWPPAFPRLSSAVTKSRRLSSLGPASLGRLLPAVVVLAVAVEVVESAAARAGLPSTSEETRVHRLTLRPWRTSWGQC